MEINKEKAINFLMEKRGDYNAIDCGALNIMIELMENKIQEAIKKATLHKVNDYYNADYEGFIDKEILLKELRLKQSAEGK